MEGFLHRFEAVNQDSFPDDGFDLVIDLDISASSRENLETVINRLYVEYPKLFGNQDMPTSDDMDAAIEAALNDYAVDIKHEIKGRDDRRNQYGNRQMNGSSSQASGPAKQKEKKVEYFAVQVPASQINRVLEAAFRDASPEDARMYTILKAQRRVQTEFHVTLIHRAASGQHAEYWAKLSEMQTKASAPTEQQAFSIPEPKLGHCKVRLERLVWDDRIMAFVVRLHPGEGTTEPWQSVNAVPHVSVGTASPNIKPVESNNLLAKWLQEGCGANGIKEMMVKGNVEVEGTVKGVLQRY
jgi:tRNA ligase